MGSDPISADAQLLQTGSPNGSTFGPGGWHFGFFVVVPVPVVVFAPVPVVVPVFVVVPVCVPVLVPVPVVVLV